MVFVFNDTLDQWVLRPAAQGYRSVTPDVAERGIGNFFANLSEFNSAVNSLLQGKMDAFLASGGRFAINSTLGIAGLFDVATPMGMESRETDLGETLAIWGVPRGPYLMLPFLGPRTLRSGIGSVGDIYLSPEAYIDSTHGRNGLYGLRVVDERAELLDADALLSGDRYIFLRDAYLQRRSARMRCCRAIAISFCETRICSGDRRVSKATQKPLRKCSQNLMTIGLTKTSKTTRCKKR